LKTHLPATKKIFLLATLIPFIILLFNTSWSQEPEDEKTYSISLVQTAEVDKEIHEIEDKKVIAETYTVQQGDHLWQILRKKSLLKKRSLPKLLSMLKKLNSSLGRLDLIHPGEKIIIPLVITPAEGILPAPRKSPTTTVPIEALKDMDLENYTIKPGDRLIKVIETRYSVSPEDLYNEYLQFVQRLNPSLKDLNRIYPGQTIKLPIYSPKIARMPIARKPPSEPEPEAPKKAFNPLSPQLGDLFTQIGEEWVATGQHFIPLESGGQVSLKADSYPIINLSNGNRVIVDLYGDLPEKMEGLIKSSWENYRIVHLAREDNLRTALDKILSACDYPELYRLGEPLELEGDISLRITADWIIKVTTGPAHDRDRMIVLTLTDDHTPKIPRLIQDFLRRLDIRTIDYPRGGEPQAEYSDDMQILRPGDDLASILEMLLNVTGHQFSTGVEIPVYSSEQADFNLIIKADFYMNLDGTDCIIDLKGLEPDALSLLREHRFSVLTLAAEKDPSRMVSRMLDFLGIKFDSGPHPFMVTERDESRNIRLTIPGITFPGEGGRDVFATRTNLPQEIATFLHQRGYKILSLPFS
jgi:LysM repeat protein